MENRRELKGLGAAILASALGAARDSTPRFVHRWEGLKPRRDWPVGPNIGSLIHTKPGRRGSDRQKYFVPLYAGVFVDKTRYPGHVLRQIRSDGKHR